MKVSCIMLFFCSELGLPFHLSQSQRKACTSTFSPSPPPLSPGTRSSHPGCVHVPSTLLPQNLYRWLLASGQPQGSSFTTSSLISVSPLPEPLVRSHLPSPYPEFPPPLSPMALDHCLIYYTFCSFVVLVVFSLLE